jgi:uncharacterized membrane protein
MLGAATERGKQMTSQEQWPPQEEQRRERAENEREQPQREYVEERRVRREPWPGREDERREQLRIERRYRLAKATQIIWLITGILEALIGIRVLLRLIAANPNAGFAAFIYDLTAVFLAPFLGLTTDPAANGAVLEISSLIAMLVYGLLAWGIVRVLWIVFDPESFAR